MVYVFVGGGVEGLPRGGRGVWFYGVRVCRWRR
jgi:hypothetical protein